MKELRIDSRNNGLVVFSSERSKRPKDNLLDIAHANENKDCPFCRGNEESTTEETFSITGDDGWKVRSVYNMFPIVDKDFEGIYGVHEVMIDTYRHNGNFFDMSQDEFLDMIKMYKNRYEALIKDENVKYVSIFKNYMRNGGASLHHPHSQIISLSLIPPKVLEEIDVCREYYKSNNRYFYDDYIQSEIDYEKRVVNNSEKYLIVVPSSSKYNGEITIVFKQKIDFEQMSGQDMKELAILFKKLFKQYESVNENSPFNIYIHTHPVNVNLDDSERFNVHIHIIPRKFNLGGFEFATGIYVASSDPDELASKLRFI